jgi:hypothetical protein
MTVAATAKAVLAELTATGKATLDDATAKLKTEPVAAFLLLEPLPAKYKGTKLANQADALLQQLKPTPAVAAELRARAVLDQLKKIDAAVMASPGAYDTSAGDFLVKHGPQIQQMAALLDQLKKKHPAARATADAEKVLNKYLR